VTTFPRATSSERRLLALLTAIFVCAGLAFSVATPLFENPDEATHVDMARHYSRHPFDLAGPSLRQTQAVRGAFAATGLFDTPTDLAMAGIPAERPDYRPFDHYGGDEPATSCPVTCQNYQFIHPPAWYLAAAPVVAALSGLDFPVTVLVLRSLNVLLVSLLVWCSWRLARDLWPHRPRRALAAAVLTTAAGPLAAVAGSVNNDGLMLPLCGLAAVLIGRILIAGVDLRLGIALGAVVGLGLLTKGQLVIVAVVALVALLVAPSAERTRWRGVAAYLALGGIGGLWWLRVLVDTHGFTPSGSELLAPSAPGPWRGASFPGYLLERLPDAFGRFPGWYGWRLDILPPVLLIPIQAALLALPLGWLVCRGWRPPSPAGLRLLVLASMPVLLLLASAYTAYDTYVDNGDQHGLAPRYLYGTAPILAVGVVAALAAIVERLGLRAWIVRRAGLLSAAAVVVGAGASFARAELAAYFTSSVSLAFRRAGVVAPVAHPKAWLLVLGVAGSALLVATVRSLADRGLVPFREAPR
jgi:4-amino-4-deoxy-L-arabinose transferase-like glycosyltransferase